MHINEIKSKIIKKENQVVTERETLQLETVNSEGLAVVLGRDVKYFNSKQVESDSTPMYGEFFDILEISKGRYPEGNTNVCIQFPYIHISNSRLNGWVTGKYVFRIFDEPERRIEISNEPFLIYKSKNFGVGSMDSSGNITGCEEYYPIILKSVKSEKFQIIDLNGDNPIYNNTETMILHKYDEVLEINSDSNNTVLKIRTEGMEGGKYYDLKLTRTDKGLIRGEINNVTEWTF